MIMNNINNGSSNGNFMKNVHLEFVRNKKTLLLCVLSIWALYIFAGFCMGWKGMGGGTAEIITFSIMAMFISTIVASMAFSNMKTKEQRIFSLMIPASVESKFFTRWIAVVPLLFIVLLSGFYLGDLARIGTRLMEGEALGSNYMNIINPFCFYTGYGDPDGALICCLAFGSYFFNQSLYFLGAILWPKLSFLKTFAALYVLQTVCGFIFMFNYNSFALSFIDGHGITTLWIIASVMIMLTLTCYCLAYLKFKNSQVVYKLF